MSREQFGSYAWDADNHQKHLEKHGVSFQSAAIALDHGRPLSVAVRNDGRDERIANLNGETLKVVCEKHGDETHIISAHKHDGGRRNFSKQYDLAAAERNITKNTEHNPDFAAWRRLDKYQYDNAKPAVDIQRERQQNERKRLDQRADLAPEQRAQLQAQQADQHKQQAQEDRKPRLERDAKEREQLALTQGRTVETQPVRKLSFYDEGPAKKPDAPATEKEKKGGLQFYEEQNPQQDPNIKR
jgi:uncharacterized DUF497 family protein